MNSTSKVLAKRRDLYETHDALDQRKRQYAKDDIELQTLESSLTTDDNVLQQELIKFTKLLEENESTRKRAEASCGDELMIRNELSADLEIMRDKLEGYESRETALLHDIEEYSIYDEYLKDVLNRHDEFLAVDDIIDRFKTLVRVRSELQAKSKDTESRNTAIRNDLDQYLKDAAIASVTLSNDATTLSYERETLLKHLQSLQEQSDAIAHQSTLDTLTVGQVQRSVENILTLLISSRGTIQHMTIPSLTSAAIHRKLEALGCHLRDLCDVADAWQKEKKEKLVFPGPLQNQAENQPVPEFFRPKLKTQPSFSSKTQSMGFTNN